ncbi:hypothetical protein POSPLADRAFT_1107943, partial [Postia placenta MAD-698-R-SB12]
NLRPGTPVLSLPALAFPKLSPVQVKQEEILISLQTLHQSQSLKRGVRVKKESRSPSIHFMVGPHHRTRSPPRLQSLSYVTPPPGFLQCLHRRRCRKAAHTLAPPKVHLADSHNHRLRPWAILCSPLSPSSPIMSSPAAVPDKETLKLLLPLRYDGKSVVECNRFISQLLIYWTINTALSSLELKIQVALSLLDGDTRAWATPIFSQLASVQIGIQGATTPFADEKAFLKAFKARFGNLDDAAAAQVELSKLCADKTMREKRTAAEFSALFKGPADRSGYGNLELRDKYLSSIPSHVYRKLELETFATWQDADKRATEVEQILDVSRARRPKLNSFFSARGRGRGGARGGAP